MGNGPSFRRIRAFLLAGLALVLALSACRALSAPTGGDDLSISSETEPTALTPTLIPTPVIEDTPAAGGGLLEQGLPCVAPGDPAPPLDLTFESAPLDLLGYLNAGATTQDLIQALDAAVIGNRPDPLLVGDMTGDGLNELAVSIFNPLSSRMPPEGMLLIYRCLDGGYELALRRPSEGGPHLWFMADMNGDRGVELVVGDAVCGAHTCFEDVSILSWDGEGFVDRMAGETGELPYPTVELRDPEGDGLLELAVTGTGSGSVGAGPQRSVTWVFAYNPESGLWEKAEEIPGEALFRIHALYDADRAAREGEIRQAIALYERVIGDAALQDWQDPQAERDSLAAYARYRLVVLYSLEGAEAFARAAFDELEQAFPAGNPRRAYVELARAFLDAYSEGGQAAGCEAARAYAREHAPAVLGPISNFGYTNREYTEEDICHW